MPTTPLGTYLAIGKLVGILAAIAVICWQSSQIHKWHQQSDHFAQRLNEISSTRDQQKVVTTEKIKVVTEHVKDADGKAKKIETAPLPGGCQSPKEVLDADI